MPATTAPHRTSHDIAPNPNPRTRRTHTPGVVARPLTLRSIAPLADEAPVAVAPRPEPASEVARAARRRRRHRALKMPLPLMLLCGLLLVQMVALLWLQGKALSARDEASRLDKGIAVARAGIAGTQERIAEIDSSAQVGRWAQDGGWKQAEQGDFDDITDRRPRPLPEQIAAQKAKAGEAR